MFLLLGLNLLNVLFLQFCKIQNNSVKYVHNEARIFWKKKYIIYFNFQNFFIASFTLSSDFFSHSSEHSKCPTRYIEFSSLPIEHSTKSLSVGLTSENSIQASWCNALIQTFSSSRGFWPQRNFPPFLLLWPLPPSSSSLRPYGVLHSEHQPLMNMPFIAVHSQSLQEARLTLQLVYFIS